MIGAISLADQGILISVNPVHPWFKLLFNFVSQPSHFGRFNGSTIPQFHSLFAALPLASVCGSHQLEDASAQRINEISSPAARGNNAPSALGCRHGRFQVELTRVIYLRDRECARNLSGCV